MLPNLDALDRTEFVALNICRTKHPALPGDGWGWQASLQRSKGDGYSVRIEPTCSGAVAAVLGCEVALPACPVVFPPCPVGLPV
jgi:hypothetical protein